MGDFSSEVTVSDTPGHPDEPPPKRKIEPKPCKACESTDTRCTYYIGGGSIIGTYQEEEFLCAACGKYTTYVEEYES